MPNEPERSRDREADLQKSIRKLQENIASNQALSEKEDIRMILGHLAWIVTILNSEYGTIMRILDKVERHEHMIDGNGDTQNSMGLRDLYKAMHSWRRFRWFVGTGVTMLVIAKLFEGIAWLQAHGAIKP